MKKVLVLVLAFIILAPFNIVSAQSNSTTESPALKMDLEWGPNFDNGTQEAKGSYLGALNAALGIVKSCQPSEDNLFNWKGNRAVLKNKTFEIYYTDSDDGYLTKKVTEAKTTITKSTDALTLFLTPKDKTTTNIFLCILSDRIFFDENNKERVDGIARLTVALGHEIYGNTQMYLEYDLSTASTKALPSRKQSEIKAFTAGINFINRVLYSFKNGALSKIPNKDKLVGDFTAALNREQASLEQWKKVADVK